MILNFRFILAERPRATLAIFRISHFTLRFQLAMADLDQTAWHYSVTAAFSFSKSGIAHYRILVVIHSALIRGVTIYRCIDNIDT